MSKIPGPFFVIVGLFVAIISKIGPLKEQTIFKGFFYLGIIFFVIGVIRIINPEKIPKDNIQEQKRPESNIINCPQCGTKNLTKSRFCHMCGYQLNR